jgi:hypothetical protein
MKIHIILSSDARYYLGLKTGDLKPVSAIPKDVHWYGVWRMDCWPNDLAALPEQTDCSPLILVNKATRFALLEMDHPGGWENFKGNLASYLQWPLHLGSFPTESYGTMKICFYRGAERSLAASMMDMRESAKRRALQEGGHWKPADCDRVLSETQEWLNDVPLQVNKSRSAKEIMREMILGDPPVFFASKYGQGRKRGEPGEVIPLMGGERGGDENATLKQLADIPAWTDRQGQFLAFISAYTLVNGLAPAEADLQRFFGISAPSVHSMVVRLDEAGFIKRVCGKGRSISLLVPPENLPALRGRGK